MASPQQEADEEPQELAEEPVMGSRVPPQQEVAEAADDVQAQCAGGALDATFATTAWSDPGRGHDEHLMTAIATTQRSVEAMDLKVTAVEAAVSTLQATSLPQVMAAKLSAIEAAVYALQASRDSQADDALVAKLHAIERALATLQNLDQTAAASAATVPSQESSSSKVEERPFRHREVDASLEQTGGDLTWEVKLWDSQDQQTSTVLRRPLLKMGRMQSNSTVDLNPEDLG
eukprot:gb/GFBE01039708.1/.p1 GENE.gb/GFBE01039708.1/~~gb/GFBE01039708.1/.p1  ORF type:complete len:232 (+),score=49.69 gb/GFBE01039708.1/:1-696(+)